MSIQRKSNLNIFLEKDTRTLFVKLDRPETRNAMTLEMLHDLEETFNWASERIEINSIVLSSTSNYFCSGLDEDMLCALDNPGLTAFLKRLQKLIYGLFYLPQTLIIDLREGCSDVGTELSLPADIRIAHHTARVEFSHLKTGIVPCCGGIGVLSKLIAPAVARSWVLSSLPIDADTLFRQGFICHIHNHDEFMIKKFLRNIAEQGPVQRMQAKMSFLESMKDDLDRSMVMETGSAFAGLLTMDWKEFRNAKNEKRVPEFTQAKEMAKIVKRLQEDKTQDKGLS